MRPPKGSEAVYEIHGARFSTLEGFYEEVSEVLIPGIDWGHNLDAFDDILRGGFGTPEGGFRLIWIQHSLSKDRLGYPETIRQLENRLVECHPKNRADVAEELKHARAGLGPTVFDWLVEILHDHGAEGSQWKDHVALVLA